ncbi:MAG: 16S rRNA (cytosine(1402)-N(4))-methyltransferase RsmH [Bacteroidota bacterium]
MSDYHRPVLLTESVDLLNIQEGGIYVDVTFGGGGHSKEILSRLGHGQLITFDRDPDAQRNLPQDERVVFVANDFQFIEEELKARGVTAVNGVLADLGVSSHQFDTAERGFSYRFSGPLDMRMNPTHGQTAAELIQEADEDELAALFRTYGEVPNSRKLARTIVQGRSGRLIQSTEELVEIVRPCVPPKRGAKYLAQVFQALRIEVNNEMRSLEKLLMGGLEMMAENGRFVIIAYHSLEDRMVKHFFRSGNFAGKVEKDFYGNPLTPWKMITRKAIQADEPEVAENPRARSARLRAVEKCTETR